MDSLPVFVADWEMACCGEPFSIGTEVRWCLDFLYEDEMTPPSAVLLPADSPVCTAVTAGIADPALTGGLRGMLLATWHGGRTESRPPVAGVVRRIRLVRQHVVRQDRQVTVVPGSAGLTELTASRSRFATGSMRTRDDSWAETGLIVDLALDVGDVIAALAR